MSVSNHPGNIACEQVHELLSDIVDVRRGDIPPEGVSPLADASFRASTELHLAGCADCRQTLDDMADVGLAFSEFSVGEKPAQDFNDYARLVYARMNGEVAESDDAGEPAQKGYHNLDLKLNGARSNEIMAERRPRRSPAWWGVLLTGAAAAVLTVGLSLPFLGGEETKPKVSDASHDVINNRPTHTEEVAVADAADSVIASTNYYKGPLGPLPSRDPDVRVVDLDTRPANPVPFRLLIPAGARTLTQTVVFDPDPAKGEAFVKWVTEKVNEYGVVALRENAMGEQTQKCLLGVMLMVNARKLKDAPAGLTLGDIMVDSPAHRSGLSRGDIVLAINGTPVDGDSPEQAIRFLNALQQLGQGEKVHIDFARHINGHWLLQRARGVLGQYPY